MYFSSRVWKMVFVVLMLACGFTWADVRIEAAFQPSEINLGESSQLVVTVNGSATASAPTIPTIDGLEIVGMGHSTRLQFINGRMSGGVTHLYRVVALKEGLFTIPSLTVEVEGQMVKSNLITLKVGKGGASFTSTPTPTINSSGQQKPLSSAVTIRSDQPAVIQLDYPKRDLYVGELVPVDLKVFLRRGMNIEEISLPKLSGEAFTMDRLGDKPERAVSNIRGIPYDIFTWHTTIAAVQSGEHPLGAQIECTLLVSEPSRRPSFGGQGLFDDPFFDSFFGNVRRKRVTLRTEDALVKVLSLPTDGRPNDFSGAIGRFELTAFASPKEIVAGDPLTFKMEVTGSGNFDRVAAPTLGNALGFKTYSPSSRFEAARKDGYTGAKIFEQQIVPKSAEVKQTPEAHLSYFDPETRKYVTLSTPPIPLQVTASSGVPAPAPSSAVVTAAPASLPSSTPTSTGMAELVANKNDLEDEVAGWRPVPFKPWFWGLMATPVVALIVAWRVGCHRERLISDPVYARNLSADRAIREHIAAMDAAIRSGDAKAFFLAARQTLQERLGEKLGIRPETITLAEMEGQFSKDTDWMEGVEKIFVAADAVAYSGQAYSSEKLRQWRDSVLAVLKNLEKR